MPGRREARTRRGGKKEEPKESIIGPTVLEEEQAPQPRKEAPVEPVEVEEVGRRERRKREERPHGLYYEELYKPKEAMEEGRPSVPAFVRLTKSFGKLFKGLGKGAYFTPQQQEAVSFLGYDISPEEFHATYKGIFISGILLGVVIAFGLLSLPAFAAIDDAIKIVFVILFILAPVVLSFAYQKYLFYEVEKEKMMALAYVPEIINYLVMTMRLSPNLERAVEFAAAHGRGKIAEDFKKLVWDVQIGKYSSIEEGLDELAYRWGNYNDDFKHALMLIRSSVLENDPQRREALLEKALEDVLEGSKEKMDLYARRLHQPTVYLYYFGILLPLLLAIILPIASSLMGGLNLAKAEYVFLIYNLFIPIAIFFWGGFILAGRPPTYVPPDIPERFPGLPKKGLMKVLGLSLPYFWTALMLLIALVWAGHYLDNAQIEDMLKSAPYLTKDEVVAKLPNIPLFYSRFHLFVGQFTIYGLVIGVSLFASVYFLGKYGARKKIQDEIRGMEAEFKDALYVLASRLGENRPIEDALRHSIEFLPKSRIANTVFRKILDNISTLGMTLENAISDPVFGATKNLPSQVIRGGLNVLVNSVQLGVNVAAKSLMSLAIQLRNAQKIDEMLRKLLEDVTVMLKSMATFVAPIVLAVIASMQRLIISSLSSIAPVGANETLTGTTGFGGMGGLTKMFSAEVAKNAADPATFMLIIGVYTIEVVAVLTYFNSQIEDTNNKLHTYVSIAYALPIAAILFCATSYIASSFFVAAG